MKDKGKKHDHKGTKILKLSIFASVMLAPLFAIAFKCAYATFNKNAYQSYSAKEPEITYKYQTNEVNSIDDLVEGNIYTFTYNNTIQQTARLGIDRIVFNDDIEIYNLQQIGTAYDTTIRINTTINNIAYDCVIITNFNQSTNMFTSNEPINFIYGNASFNQNAQYIIPMISKCINVPISGVNENANYPYLDNAFYYAIDEMKDNELFAWTKNTALYTPINAMTSGLGITTDAIAVLLAYWLYITLIYVVFDIVIELFTYLSHLIMGNPIG